MKNLLVVFLLCSILWGNEYEVRYPSYTYVFSEFGIDNSYIDNDDFKDFILKHEKRIKVFYKNAIKRGESLLPLLQRKLMDRGVSDLFLYLSMVESGFSVSIHSSKNAVGLWQFMPGTARAYNLEVCQSRDERCDPVSSTHAAIDYLKKLYKEFGKWYLAMMAYNCGEGRMRKAIQEAGTTDLAVLTDETKKYLPRETRFYIRKILLAAMIGENITLGFGRMPKERESEGLIRVFVRAGESWKIIEESLSMSQKELKDLNPVYSSFDHLPKEEKRYPVMIPEEKIYAFYLRYDLEHFERSEEKSFMVSYVVKMGDTLDSIAKSYDVEMEALKRINHLEKEYLEVGQLLVLPVKKKNFYHYIENTE